MRERNTHSAEEIMDRINQAMTAIKFDKVWSAAEKGKAPIQEDPNHIIARIDEMDMEIRQNNLKWSISSEWLITSHRRFLGKFIVFGKRLVRKFLRWYLNPSWDQQREFNGSVTRSLNIMSDVIHLLLQRNIDLNNQLNACNQLLRQQTDYLENEIKILKSNNDKNYRSENN